MRPMKSPVIRTANPKMLDQPQYLTSWKEIADYMRSGVRTVQRYEREFGLPIRRPTGKSRGSVIATRAEIDAWVAAAPIREAFKLTRTERFALTRNETDKLENGVIAMRKLKAQMLELRNETRSALNLFMDRLSSVCSLLPARPGGYEPLTYMDIDIDIDMDMDMDIDMDMERRLHLERGERRAELSSEPSASRTKDGTRRRNHTSVSPTKKPH